MGVFNYDMTYAVTLTAQDGADIYYEIAEGKDKAPVPTTKSKKFETYQYGQIEITQARKVRSPRFTISRRSR